MRQLYRLRAFPKTASGGNKAAVYLFADNLHEREMRLIAESINYSETAFVLESKIADFNVKFFTPATEVDLCGHATIATFNLLRDLNIIQPGMYTQETIAGILNVEVLDNQVFMEQSRPIFDSKVDWDIIYSCFENFDHHPTLEAQIVSTGMKEIFVPVKNRQTLNKIVPNRQRIIEVSQKLGIIGIHAFCLDDKIDAFGRNFAPAVGIDEESATGTSNGALACYLYKYHKKKKSYHLEQGHEMKQPSKIITRLYTKDNYIKSVWVGGNAIHINEKIDAF